MANEDVNVKMDRSLKKPLVDFLKSPKNRNQFGTRIYRSRKAVVTKALEQFLEPFLPQHEEKQKVPAQ